MCGAPFAFVSAVLGDERSDVAIFNLTTSLEDDDLASVDELPGLAKVVRQ